MWFHKKNKKDVDDPYQNYEVLCGIEEEFLLVNKEGTLVQGADDVMVKAANILEENPDLLEKMKLKIRGLDAEPSPAQIEYVTLPLPPNQLEDAITTGRTLLRDAANKLGYKILAQSLHPIQSSPNPIVGTHINVSVQRKGSLMTPNDMKSVYNYLWNFLPEYVGMSANSPIYEGNYNKIASNRYAKSKVLKMNSLAKFEIPDNRPALVPIQYYGRRRYQLKIGSGFDEFSKKVITNSKGHRLVDITPRGPSTNIGDDKDDSPTRNRIEIRIFDVQPDEDYLLKISYLTCASALHAIYLEQNGDITQDSHHQQNLENAIRHGNNVELRRNGKKITLRESVENWIKTTEKYQKYLGFDLSSFPQQIQERHLQPPLDIHFKTRKIEELRQKGKVYAVVRVNKTRIVSDNKNNKYKVPKGAKIHGSLSADYELKYHEIDGIITDFDSISVTNTLEVQGLEIPLNENDQILESLSQGEYMTQRLFRGFPFPF